MVDQNANGGVSRGTAGPVIRPGRPRVRTTFQLAATVVGSNDIASAWTQCVRTSLSWLQRKFPVRIPQRAFSGQAFHAEVPGQEIRCIADSSLGVWSTRLIQPDAPFRDRAAVPGRTWTTEIALRETEGKLQFAIRVLCASLPYADPPITLTRPQVVVDLAESVGLQGVAPLNGKPWVLSSADDLESFHSLLTNPKRTFPVYLLTEADPARLKINVSRYVVDEFKFAQRTQGVAYVVVLPSELSYEWSSRVGKPWSCYLGAVRTYRPALDFEEDSPWSHPFAMPEKIVFWRHHGLEGENAFSTFLTEQAFSYAATKQLGAGHCLFYADAKALAARQKREAAEDEADWKELYESEIEALKGQLEQLEDEKEESFRIASQVEEEREHYRGENARLRAQNDAIRRALEAKTGSDYESAETMPSTYDEVEEWVAENLVGRLELHPRASRGLRRAEFEDVGLVVEALLILARQYRDMRLGYQGAKEGFEGQIHRLGLKFGPSISGTRAGEQGDEYFVSYPIGSQQRQFLESHLKKGTAHDQRHCLRIYFFWHDESQQVIVGWLPGHLTTRGS